MDEKKEPGLYEVMAEKLQLDQMYGQVLASLFLIAQLLPALVEAGVFTNAQVEEMTARASASLDSSIDSDPDRSDPSNIRKSAHSALADLRSILTARDQPQ